MPTLIIAEKPSVARGIAEGDVVESFNDRGRVQIPARVTPRIMPGVASLPQGAWMKLDADGVDHGAGQRQVEAVLRAVAVHAGEQDFAGA